MLVELLFWSATISGALGTILNAWHIRAGFYFWMYSNLIAIVQGVLLMMGVVVMVENLVWLYVFYFLFNFVGLWRWKQIAEKEGSVEV